MVSEVGGIGQLDNLKQGILDDGIGEACGDIRHLRAFLLRLLDVGIHEDGAPGAQIRRVLGEQCDLCEILHAVIQGFCEGFDEGTAAGGAGLVQHNAVDGAVLDLDALHVLAADVQDAVHIRLKGCCGIIVGNGLDLALIQHEGGLQQGLAVSGGAGVGDGAVCGKKILDLLHGADGCRQRAAVVVAVEVIKKGSVLADQGQLCGGGTGVNSQEALSVITAKIALLYGMARMVAAEGLILFLAAEQGLHPLDFLAHLHAGGQAGDQIRYGLRGLLIGIHGRAQGSEQMGVIRCDDLGFAQIQGPDKGLAQLRQEVQRSAQERHIAPDGLAAGQAADGLVDHCLENGFGQVFSRGALVDQRLNVCLGKNTAARCDGVDHLVIFGILIQTRSVRLKKGGHLVNERTGAAGAESVHALVDTAGEIYDFGIFPAQLDGDVTLRCIVLQGGGYRHNFLHEGDGKITGKGQAAGAGDNRVKGYGAKLLSGFGKKVRQRFLDVGKVPFIIGKKYLICRINDCNFDCRGTDVDSKAQL